jgi:hypothetical protein
LEHHIVMRAAAVAIVGAALAGQALADPITAERLRVIDGDTVSVVGVTYRLVGFDAPETGRRAKCASEAVLGERAACHARSPRASLCQSPAMPNGRCRMHGGTLPGARRRGIGTR